MINNNVGYISETPKREFNSSDFNDYMKRIGPYYNKVFKEKRPLTDEEIDEIKRVYMELNSTYTSGSLKEKRIMGRIDAITGFNMVILQRIKHEEMRNEAGDLSEELSTRLKDGTLTPQERERICGRVEQIYGNLHPEYH